MARFGSMTVKRSGIAAYRYLCTLSRWGAAGTCSSIKALPWTYVPPGTVSETALKIVCAKRQ